MRIGITGGLWLHELQAAGATALAAVLPAEDLTSYSVGVEKFASRVLEKI